MKVSDYIARFLEDRGVPFVFEMSGGMITHMLDSLHQRGRVRVVSMHHEQAAAFAADALGRVTGIPGVAMATSGPGATNLLTGIGSCYFDSSPAVFITGQVNRYELKGARQIRQLGFQETDIVSMARPITKGAWLVEDPQDVPEMLRRAFDLATEGRPGPVLLDVPMDVQRAEIEPPAAPPTRGAGASYPDRAVIQRLLRDLATAERPLILAGAGVRAGAAIEPFRQWVEESRVPVVTSLLGLDVLAYDHPQRVGMIGSYGNRWANLAVARSDLLLVLGSRLDIRQTGADVGSFRADRVVYHVDCEPGELNNRVTECVAVESQLRPFLEAALEGVARQPLPERSAWQAELKRLAAEWPDTAELRDARGINPNVVMHQLSRAVPQASAYVADVGQHQMWAAQSLELTADQRFLTSGGMGSMGFALPAAVGAALAVPGRPVVVVAGDGGFQSNIQELQTVVRNRLPVKMVVLNNECHGMVRQFQQSYFESRYQSTMWGYSAPDFGRVAAAYGIPSWTVAEPEQVEAGVRWLCGETDGPALLQVMVDPETNVYPKMAFGRPISEMEPFAQPLEMEGT